VPELLVHAVDATQGEAGHHVGPGRLAAEPLYLMRC